MQLWARKAAKWKSKHNEAPIRSTFWLICTGWCESWRSVIWVLMLYWCNRKASVHTHYTDTADLRDNLREEGFLKVRSSGYSTSWWDNYDARIEAGVHIAFSQEKEKGVRMCSIHFFFSIQLRIPVPGMVPYICNVYLLTLINPI